MAKWFICWRKVLGKVKKNNVGKFLKKSVKTSGIIAAEIPWKFSEINRFEISTEIRTNMLGQNSAKILGWVLGKIYDMRIFYGITSRNSWRILSKNSWGVSSRNFVKFPERIPEEIPQGIHEDIPGKSLEISGGIYWKKSSTISRRNS